MTFECVTIKKGLLKLFNYNCRRKRGFTDDDLILNSHSIPVAPVLSMKMTEKEMSDKIASTELLDDDEMPFITNLQNAW